MNGLSIDTNELRQSTNASLNDTYSINTNGSSSNNSYQAPINTETTREVKVEDFDLERYVDAPTSNREYKVKAGDTLASIARDNNTTV